MSVRDILSGHADSPSQLKVRLLAPEEFEGAGYVLLEGDSTALNFLGELLIAHAKQTETCDLQIHPSGAGSLHFTKGSNLGFYIHLVCACDAKPKT
jgi:hypothetical protein